MLNGICLLPVIPMRKKKSDKSEMINQILFGETFNVLKKLNQWSYIELDHDGYQGWISNQQYEPINTETTFNISNKKYSNLRINGIHQPLILGSLIPKTKSVRKKLNISENLSFCKMEPFELWFIKIAKKYLNSPYLWGGRTPLGIDCSGYTQMVYRFFNIKLPRDAWQQAKKGKKIFSFKDLRLGDLAFFEKNKSITHVGIVLGTNKIIHASGKVKIDVLDEKGIFNTDTQSYTHQLKYVKRII